MGYAAALPLYLAAGWRGVLPVPPGSKGPPPTGFTGVNALDPTEADLARWVNDCKDWNLALRLPPDVLGIDVDAYEGKPGATTLEQLELRLGVLPATVVSSARPAPSGIRFFRVPTGRAWRSPGPGIDLIHHGHRYAVVWPSIHPSGAEYVWRGADGDLLHGVPGAVPWIEELPVLP
jgi:Bifunctional DNA primase/polymerase, N-terminal